MKVKLSDIIDAVEIMKCISGKRQGGVRRMGLNLSEIIIDAFYV